MKKLLCLSLCLVGLSFIGMQAKCINAKHAKQQNVRNANGVLEESQQYPCTVKGSESKNFDESGICKNCGCPDSRHDNQ